MAQLNSQPKAHYTTPELIVYGNVEEITKLFGASSGDIPQGVSITIGIPPVAITIGAPGTGSRLLPRF